MNRSLPNCKHFSRAKGLVRVPQKWHHFTKTPVVCDVCSSSQVRLKMRVPGLPYIIAFIKYTDICKQPLLCLELIFVHTSQIPELATISSFKTIYCELSKRSELNRKLFAK